MVIRKPETAQQKANASDWWLFTQHWMSNNASESDYESSGCDCSDGLNPDRGGRYTRMRSWEAGAHPDRETVHWFCQWNLNSKVFLKFNSRQSSMTSMLTIAGHVHSMIHFDYICPSQPTRPRHGEVNREPRERSVRSSLNLWSGRKRWDYMNSWRRYWKNFPCRNNYWLVWNKSNETNSFI